MPEQIRIIKRNGEAEPLNISKINKVVTYSCAGLDGVSASEIIKQASLHFTDGMSTERIQEILIKAANELVTKETPNYTIPAARLNLYDVRKRVFHDHAVPTVQEHVQNLVEKGIYHETLLQYTNEDFERFEQAIDHDRDDNFSTAAVGQLTDKYLLRDRTKGSRSFYETPQFMYMAIAMTLFSEYPRSEKRTQDIIDFYHGASTFKFSLPTPIMGGARTPTRQFSSCVLINCGDTLDSINATATAITNYVSKKAGIGVAHGSIRAEGAAIRKGEMVHTGVVPFLKYHVGALKSCCLHPEMLVETDRGFIKMKDLKVGDKIKTKDGEEVLFKTVTDKFNTRVSLENQRRLTFENGVVINCSNNHPTMVLECGLQIEVLPDELLGTHDVITPEGVTHLSKCEIIETDTEDFLDITVEDTHTFFTAETIDQMKTSPVLTHNSQGGLRGGSATFYYPWWHLQIEDILVLKNNKGTYENRERRVDYGINFNRKIFQEFLKGGDVYLFSPEEVVGLEEAFYSGDNDKFEETYDWCVDRAKRGEIRFKKIPASMLIHEFVEQRSETGRIYAKFSDNVNKQSPFDQNKHPIHSSNLCFTGDTMVATADGRNMVSIKELAESTGDSEKFPVFSARWVKSTNEGFWDSETKPALAFKTASDVEVVKVELSNGASFKCTPDHKIALRSGEYIAAKDSVGKALEVFPKAFYRPTVISVEPAGHEDVYDLNVEDNHNFYIITNNDPKNSLGVLVHNCAEVALPTKPLHNEHDENGRIALCTLSSFNMLEFPDAVGDAVQRQALFNSAKTIVRALDGLLQYQDYPMIQAKLSTDEFRSLGVGVVNLASFLAYHGVKYGSPESNKRLNEWFELFTLALTTASVELAEEIGPCSKWQETCYCQGIFPHQQHPSSIFELDGVAPEKLYQREWDELSQRILKSGIRNATLSAIAPTESSSQVLNATNGVEMPTGPIAIKGSKSGNFKQPVPLPADKYQYVWDQKDCQPYLHTMAVIQRWVDQSISTNTFYSPELWGGTIPRDVIIGHIIEFYSLGGKTLYYSKMPDGATDTDEEETELPSNTEDEDCDSCKV